MKSMTIDYGIDLGTTNSTIARINEIDTEVFKNNDGSESTPSAVWMDKKERIQVGILAKNHVESDPGNGFIEFKRDMGSKTKYTFERNGQVATPEEFSSLVLKSLKEDVRRRLGEEINSVVITVPADFELPACNATNEAAEMAGFKCHPLLQEPIAAAMAYGFQSESDNKFWMVYDFGGGTFDAAIIQIKDGQIEVVNHGGDNHLGGKDLDWEIVNKLLVPAVIEEFGLSDFNRGNEKYKMAFAKLKAAAEKAKIRLSLEESVDIDIDNLFKNDNGEIEEFSFEISKKDFQQLAKPLIQRSINICKKVLQEKRLGTSNIEKMLMVGGTSLIPYLRELLLDQNEGLGIPLESSIDPLTVVAKGAAIFASTQMAPAIEKEDVKQGDILLELDYQPVGTDTEPPIGGKIITDEETDFTGYTIEFINRTVKPEWRSGKINLSAKGGFINQLWAEKGKKNIFNIELFDNTGSKLNTVPENISYTFGVISAEAPLNHSLGVAMANNETDFLLKKGMPLPARNTSVHRIVSEIRVGQSEDMINIPFVAGENERRADHNMLIGSLVIPATNIRRNLPAGSEIEITLIVDSSLLVTARAYIPILDEEFDVKANLTLEANAIEDLIKSFSRAKEKYEKLIDKAEDEQDANALSILAPVESENMINEIESLLDSAKVDQDSRSKAQNIILNFNTILDRSEEALEWPTLVVEARNVIQKASDLTDEYGDSDDRQKFNSLRTEIEIAINEKDPDLLSRRIGQMDGYYWILLKEQPGFWVSCFEYAKENQDNMRDLVQAENFIVIADKAIINNDVEGLKAAVQNLYDMLPASEQEKLGFGGTTYRV